MPAATATDCCRPSATTQGSFALGGWGEGEGISAETILSYGVYGWLEACGSVHLMLEVSVFALLPTQWSADGILAWWVKDPVLLWRWGRPAATVLIRP